MERRLCCLVLLSVLVIFLVSRLGEFNQVSQLAQAQAFASTFKAQVNQSNLKFMMSGRKPWVMMDDGRAYNFTSQGWISCGDEKVYCPQAQTPNAYAPASGDLRGSELFASHCSGLVAFFFQNPQHYLPSSCGTQRFGCEPKAGEDYQGLFYLDSIGDRCRFISMLDPNVRVEYTNNDGAVTVFDQPLIDENLVDEDMIDDSVWDED